MPTYESLSRQIVEIGREFHAHGWLPATSGNLSAVIGRQPLRLAMTASGVDKGKLNEGHVLQIDEAMSIVGRHGPSGLGARRLREAADAEDEAYPSGELAVRPSDEALLHVYLARECGAGAILHTHSVWSTLVSDLYASEGGVTIEGYEMLKALEGIKTHEHREWLPIVENDQDMTVVASRLADALGDSPGSHGFLLRGHGLYCWADSLGKAKRHAEALEFLLEVILRHRSLMRG